MNDWRNDERGSDHELGGARERWSRFGGMYASIDTQCAWLPAQSNSSEL